MKNLLASFVLAAGSFFATGSAQAASLNLTSLGSGFLGTTSVSPAGAVVSTPDGTDLFRGAGGIANSICAIDGNVCEADLEVDFTSSVENLSFQAGGYNSGDYVQLSIYDPSNALLGTTDINADGVYDLSSYGTIGRLFFDDSSTGAGFVFGNFTFDVSANVPLPAGLPLLVAGLGALGMIRRNRA